MNLTPESGGGSARVLLHWLPLGAGGHVVALNGRVYEAICARRQRRHSAPLFHAALSLRLGGASYVIEMGPVWGNAAAERGVVVEGPVGLPVLGRSRLFRYEVRAWLGGSIPDLKFAVGVPTVMSRDSARAANLLALAHQVPPLTWGRDELGLGEMWNSNSIIAWLLLRSDHDLWHTRPPAGGRAPGWGSGIVLALSLDDGVQAGSRPRSRRCGRSARTPASRGSRPTRSARPWPRIFRSGSMPRPLLSKLGHSSPAITREFYITKPAIAPDVADVLDELAEADPEGGPNTSGIGRE